MAIKFQRPWLGIAIPCFIIAFTGYGAHFFILRHYLAFSKQILFQSLLVMIWVSYYLAIYTDPGAPAANFKPNPTEWENYCKKCENHKPERSHHCKTCNRCVLMMDHHCPWTMNCVGYKNFAHFMRFLFWVIVTTSYLLNLLLRRAVGVYHLRKQPSNMIRTSEIAFLTVLIPTDFFVFFTIAFLFARCLKNQVFRGMSQIETWEFDRIESLYYNKRLMPLLISNASKIFSFEQTAEMNAQVSHLMKNQLIMPMYEFVNFPYDLEIRRNAALYLGPWWSWLLPWGSATLCDGAHFPKNALAEYDGNADLCDNLLALPWPPDGNTNTSLEDAASSSLDVLQALYDNEEAEAAPKKVRKLDPRLKLRRNEWYNDLGENLSHFGVDEDELQ